MKSSTKIYSRKISLYASLPVFRMIRGNGPLKTSVYWLPYLCSVPPMTGMNLAQYGFLRSFFHAVRSRNSGKWRRLPFPAAIRV